MFKPPCPRAAPTGDSGFLYDASSWPAPARQVQHGFEEGDANRSDGLDLGDYLSQGKCSICYGIVH